MGSQAANRRLVRRLWGVVFGMFCFGFALVPLYDVFCEIAGLNGKPGQIDIEQAALNRVDKNREVTVEFVAYLNRGFPWQFRPLVNRMRVHPGESVQVAFYARNLADKATTGRAVPSVAPNRAAQYFNKIECFCFTEQKLERGESREMPVRFFVDPELPSEISTLTLSYTFFSAQPSPSKPDTGDTS